MENNETKEPGQKIISPEELEELLSANLACSREILDKLKDIKKYIFWQQFWGALKFLIIIVPIILGFIYLPPLIRDTIDNYRNLLGWFSWPIS